MSEAPISLPQPAPVPPPESQPPGGGLDLAGLLGGLLGRGAAPSTSPEVITAVNALAQALQIDGQIILQLFSELRAAREDAQYWRRRAEKLEQKGNGA